MNKELLRELPAVDELCRKCMEHMNNTEKKDGDNMPNPSFLTHTVREVIDELRKSILDNKVMKIPSEEELINSVWDRITGIPGYSLKRVINGTGITLHTNLGRAPLTRSAAQHVYDIACGYCNLEYDIETGNRGSRYSHVEQLLCELTGAESALAVNNNAAAMMLTLHALGYGKEMIISRGEMVEIGGSFRIPAVMQISGVSLREVGCTNKTRLSDYTDAINDNTAAVLKVHTSNYVIKGFTESVSIESLKQSEAVSEKEIPVIYDLGSGEWSDVDLNADIICFSADKLLGGPQGGIICGRKKYIDLIKKDDLIRALRLDKLSIAALEATLTEYTEKNENDIPVRQLLNMTVGQMEEKFDVFSRLVSECLTTEDVKISEVYTTTETGGGSRPEESLKEVCAGIEIKGLSAETISNRMRTNQEIPIIGRIHDDVYMLSMRTTQSSDFELIINAIKKIIEDKQI